MEKEKQKTPEELRKELFDKLNKSPEVLHEIAMPGVNNQIKNPNKK